MGKVPKGGRGGSSRGLVAVVILGLQVSLQAALQWLLARHGDDSTVPLAWGSPNVLYFATFAMMVVCYARAAFSKGERIRGWPWDPTRAPSPAAPPYELKNSTGGRRYCKTCQVFKPDRAHHCHRCGQCHLGMDHHDILLLNCVHHQNQKDFFLFTFYAALHGGAALYIMTAYRISPTTFYDNVPRDGDTFDMESFVRSMQYKAGQAVLGSIAILAVVVFGGWCLFNVFLLANGYKTIEFTEKRLPALFAPSPASHKRSVLRIWAVLNPYSLGRYANLRAALGTPLVWFLPTTFTTAGNDLALGYRPVPSTHGVTFFTILKDKWEKKRKTK